uniref:Purple acid phosphatase n=1 Tax=Kalanchoe fedtschenkoi TaxID=63787 RepID=A0A7N0VJH8_KALFE
MTLRSTFAHQWKFLLPALALAVAALMGSAICYERPLPRDTIHTPLAPNLDSSSPQQVHISLVGEDKMRISWITTDSEAPSSVFYGTSQGNYEFNATGTSSSYHYLLVYKSGLIHDTVIGPLQPDTTYFYQCGTNKGQEFTFKTPPATFPIKFAVSGDLGQTGWTETTLDHISKSDYDVLLLPGDLSYADVWQPSWDSFGRLVAPLASQRPWMVATGNHEVEQVPVVHPEAFTAYNARWHMPFEESNSPSNEFYSFDVAGVHVVVLGSYSDFGQDSPQYKWAEADLNSVDRTTTPWVIVIIHAPWYNSNEAHQGELESVDMKQVMEQLVYIARVDIVFAGHVHAYERFTRLFEERADGCGPVHITIGDGGNREGLATRYEDPQPEISLFREASFGHGQLEVVNATHAQWTWHRNDDDQATVADSAWFTSLASDQACKGR